LRKCLAGDARYSVNEAAVLANAVNSGGTTGKLLVLRRTRAFLYYQTVLM